MSSEWVFLIKTDSYAGNFERALCGYITGMVGECGVGGLEAQVFYEEMGLVPDGADWDGVSVESIGEDWNNPFALIVAKRADEHGCCRPAGMCGGDCVSIPDHGTTTSAIFFSEKPNPELIQIMCDRAQKYCDDYCPNNPCEYDRHEIKIQGFELWEEQTKQQQLTSWPAQ